MAYLDENDPQQKAIIDAVFADPKLPNPVPIPSYSGGAATPVPIPSYSAPVPAQAPAYGGIQNALLGFAGSMLNQGTSSTPISFGQQLGQGLLGASQGIGQYQQQYQQDIGEAQKLQQMHQQTAMYRMKMQQSQRQMTDEDKAREALAAFSKNLTPEQRAKMNPAMQAIYDMLPYAGADKGMAALATIAKGNEAPASMDGWLAQQVQAGKLTPQQAFAMKQGSDSVPVEINGTIVNMKAPAAQAHFDRVARLEQTKQQQAEKEDLKRNRPPSPAITKDMLEMTSMADNLELLERDFRPEYLSNPMLRAVGMGEVTLAAKERLGLDPKAVDWWKRYRQAYELPERHLKFGTALTPPERADWGKATISPNTDPDIAKTALAKMKELAMAAHDRSLDNAKKGLWDVSGYSYRANDRAGKAVERNSMRSSEQEGTGQPKVSTGYVPMKPGETRNGFTYIGPEDGDRTDKNNYRRAGGR